MGRCGCGGYKNLNTADKKEMKEKPLFLEAGEIGKHWVS